MSLFALLRLRKTARTEADRKVATATAVRERSEATRSAVVGRLNGDLHHQEAAGDYRLTLARRAGLLSDLARAHEALVVAEAEEERMRQLAAHARMRLKAVERLQERREDEARRRRAKAEAEELDDVVATMRHHAQDRARTTEEQP